VPPPLPTAIRTNFLWALLPSAAIALFLIVLAGTYGRTIERTFEQLEISNRRLALLQAIQVDTATYARRAYEVVLAHAVPQGDFRSARLAMERSLVRLSQETRGLAASASDSPNTLEAIVELEAARRMLELYHSIDAAASRAYVLVRDGRETEGAQVFNREVEFRLTNEFEAILTTAVSAKSQQIETLAAQLGALSEQAKIILGVLLLSLFPALAFAWFAYRRTTESGSAPHALEQRARELREANEQLRETDKRRAQFLADVSHELRTPLTILRGEADVALLPSSPANEQRISLERIQRQAADMAQMLDDLLAFARSEADEHAIAPSDVLIEDILSVAVEDAENLAEPREIALSLDLQDTGLWAYVDQRRFKQAIVVGLDNAINHTPPGGSVEVRARKTASQIIINILDTGAGLTAEDERRAFERFYRGDRSSNASGLGIGLAIAQSIVEAHNGTIALSNRPEGGGQLTIELPRLKGGKS
jgi:two-component system OmpR family sensor kinase